MDLHHLLLAALPAHSGLPLKAEAHFDEGYIELDNSPVERTITGKMRSSPGSDGGAEHCAVIASPIETRKLNDGDPLA